MEVAATIITDMLTQKIGKYQHAYTGVVCSFMGQQWSFLSIHLSEMTIELGTTKVNIMVSPTGSETKMYMEIAKVNGVSTEKAREPRWPSMSMVTVKTRRVGIWTTKVMNRASATTTAIGTLTETGTTIGR